MFLPIIDKMFVIGLESRVAFLISYYRLPEQNWAILSVSGFSSFNCGTVISDLVHEITSVFKFVCSHDSKIRKVIGASATTTSKRLYAGVKLLLAYCY
jgi:hypothetical protein